MNPLALWAMICLLLALVLYFIEVFIPSGGLLGLFSGVCAVVGVILLFRVDTTYGLIGALVCLTALPIMVAMSVKLWPQTPIGRWMMLQRDQPGVREAAAPGPAAGARGTAVTDLHPVGLCQLGEARVECLAEQGMIRKGEAVEVVASQGMQVKVRKV